MKGVTIGSVKTRRSDGIGRYRKESVGFLRRNNTARRDFRFRIADGVVSTGRVAAVAAAVEEGEGEETEGRGNDSPVEGEKKATKQKKVRARGPSSGG